MKPIDFIALIYGLLWAIITLLLLKRNKSKPRAWSLILGIGVGIYMFVSAITASILLRPISEFAEHFIVWLFLSLVGGGVAYISGHMFARRRENKN